MQVCKNTLILDKDDLIYPNRLINITNLSFYDFKFALKNVILKSDLVIFKDGEYAKILKSRY